MRWLSRLFEKKRAEEKIITVRVDCKDTDAVCAYEWEGRLFKTTQLRDQAKRQKELVEIRDELEAYVKEIFCCRYMDSISPESLVIVLLDRPAKFKKFMDAYQSVKEGA